MDLIDYVRMIARQWVLVVLCTLLGAGAGLGYALVAPVSYNATAELYVGNVLSSPGKGAQISRGDAQAASQYVLDRMPTYIALVDSPSVTGEVIKTLSLKGDVSALAARVSASSPPKTVWLKVTANAATADEAALIANATANQMGAQIEALEIPDGSSTPLVKVSRTGEATAATATSTSNKKLDLVLGVVLGMGLGLVGAYLRDQSRQRHLRDLGRPRRGDAFLPAPVAQADLLKSFDASARAAAERRGAVSP